MYYFKQASHRARSGEATVLHIMEDLEEQRRKVEELKKKILEQKTKGTTTSIVQEAPVKIIPSTQIVPIQEKDEATSHLEGVSQSMTHETQLEQIKKEEKKTALHEGVSTQQHATAMIALQAYAQALKQAWSDGVVSKDEEAMLSVLRHTLGISNDEHESLERELQAEVYIYALTAAWEDGVISTEDSERLEFFRNKFHISADEHFRLEKNVRAKLVRKK